MSWLTDWLVAVGDRSGSGQAADIGRALLEAAEHTNPAEASVAVSAEGRNWFGIAEMLRGMSQ